MIYLDSAATTLQKPPQVAQAMARAVGTMTSPGRGGHAAAQRAARLVFACREEAAGLLGISNPEQVVFTAGATHGLNIAIKSLVKPGDTVLISGYEHNAVTRPLHALGAQVKVAQGPLFQAQAMVAEFERLLTEDVRAVICTHVSNVFGYVLPVEEIARLCRERNMPLIVDAAQSAGCLAVDADRWGAAFVALPGHKGLCGPQGTGILLCRAPAVSLLEGGTGSDSLRQEMPELLPDRLEAGTHNVPGIAGLLEGIRFVQRMGVKTIAAHEKKLVARLVCGLEQIRGVRVFADRQGEDCQSGVLSFLVEGKDCETVGEQLGEMGIAVRSGLHCAPLAHRTAGTLESGTVRVSVSPFSTPRQIDLFVAAAARIAK